MRLIVPARSIGVVLITHDMHHAHPVDLKEELANLKAGNGQGAEAQIA